ncbi:cache domain-containing protein [Clostridiaceae bacterium 35-E11]
MRARSFGFKITVLFLGTIIFSFFALIGLYIHDSQKMMANVMEEDLQKLIHEKKVVLDLHLKQVEAETKELGIWLARYLQEVHEIDENFDERYEKNLNGVLVSKGGSNTSSIYVNANIPITEKLISQVVATEKLEFNFTRLLEQNQDVVCTYIVTAKGLLRLYPYLNPNLYEVSHDFRQYNYYQIATQKNNPERKAVWTKVYNDWEGRGWVVTCSYPVYINNKLEAVVCTDITVDFLQNIIADFQVAKSGFGFLLDQDGNVIYHPYYIKNAEKRGEVFAKNLIVEAQNNQYKKIIHNMLKRNEGQDFYYNSQTKSQHLITYAPINNVGWSIGLEVDESEYKISLVEYFEDYFLFSFLLIVMISFLGTMFLKGISKPITALSMNAQKIAAGDLDKVMDIKTKDEIGSIAESLNAMSMTMKEYMENLIKNKNQLETVINSIRGFLSIRSLDYRILMTNSQGKYLAKKMGKEMIDSPCYTFFEGRDKPCENCPMVETLRTGKEGFSEILSGNDIFHVWSSPVYDRAGKLEEVVVYSVKVTEKIVLEKEFFQKEKLAGIGQMAASITHELKNPLAIIKGSTYLLKEILKTQNLEQELHYEIEENLEDIDSSVKRSEQIIYHLLDFSRRSSLKKEKIDMVALIDQILILKKKTTIENYVEVSTSFSKNPLYAYASLDSMRHVFLNIIDNALYAMPNGGYLKIQGIESEEKNQIIVHITDTGIGVPQSILQKVFQPFFTTKPRGTGTGIGLWLVQNEVKKNLGQVQLISEEGKGTRVTIILPIESENPVYEGEEHEENTLD